MRPLTSSATGSHVPLQKTNLFLRKPLIFTVSRCPCHFLCLGDCSVFWSPDKVFRDQWPSVQITIAVQQSAPKCDLKHFVGQEFEIFSPRQHMFEALQPPKSSTWLDVHCGSLTRLGGVHNGTPTKLGGVYGSIPKKLESGAGSQLGTQLSC
jgi:hypothetical protein